MSNILQFQLCYLLTRAWWHERLSLFSKQNKAIKQRALGKGEKGKEQLIFIESDRAVSNASWKAENIMISPKVSVINSFYKLMQERKYLMKSTTWKHIDKGEILKLCTEKFSALGLDDEVRREEEQTEISFLRKNL